MTYPSWMLNICLEMRRQEFSSYEIESLTGVHQKAVLYHSKKAGILSLERMQGRHHSLKTRKKMSKRHTGKRMSLEARRKMSEARKGKYVGEFNPSWTGDECGESGQHQRAIKEHPKPLGACELCNESEAVVRMRIDHTLLSYSSDLVVLGCHSCNRKHDAGTVSITFLNNGKLLCAIRENGKARLLEVF